MSGKTKEFDGGLALRGKSLVGIGIDQSYTGFAVTVMAVDDGAYYTWVYKSEDRGVDRLLDIQKFLEMILLDYGWRTKDICIEAPVRMSASALMSGELFAACRITLRSVLGRTDPGYPIQVPPSTLKKYVTGRGNAQKSEMLLQVFKRWNVEFNDDNAADSYGLARIACSLAETAADRVVLKTLEDPKFRSAL